MFDDNFDIQRQLEHFEYDMNHKKRKHRNVITLSGQFATFIVEIVMSGFFISGTVYIRTLRS